MGSKKILNYALNLLHVKIFRMCAHMFGDSGVCTADICMRREIDIRKVAQGKIHPFRIFFPPPKDWESSYELHTFQVDMEVHLYYFNHCGGDAVALLQFSSWSSWCTLLLATHGLLPCHNVHGSSQDKEGNAQMDIVAWLELLVFPCLRCRQYWFCCRHFKRPQTCKTLSYHWLMYAMTPKGYNIRALPFLFTFKLPLNVLLFFSSKEYWVVLSFLFWFLPKE